MADITISRVAMLADFGRFLVTEPCHHVGVAVDSLATNLGHYVNIAEAFPMLYGTIDFFRASPISPSHLHREI